MAQVQNDEEDYRSALFGNLNLAGSFRILILMKSSEGRHAETP
jgi:hypothetical protein